MKQEVALHRFFGENRITVETGKCIVDWIRMNSSRRRGNLHEGDVVLLRDIPNRLRVQLREEVFVPILCKHPLFRAFQSLGHKQLVSLCMSGLSEERFTEGKELFTKGQRAQGLRLIRSGRLVYDMPGHESQIIQSNAWISEIALWTTWTHRGSLSAKQLCEVVVVCTERFRELLPRCPKNLRRFLRAYAALFVRH